MEEHQNKKMFNLRKPIIFVSLHCGILFYLLNVYGNFNDMNAVGICGLYSIVSFFTLILQPFVGRLSDKMGRKPILLASTLLFAASFFTFSISKTAAILYLARIIQSLAIVCLSISIYGILTDTYTDDKLSESMGRYEGFRSAGSIYGFIIFSFAFYDKPFMKGWSTIFIIFAICALISFFIVLKTIPETRTTSLVCPKQKTKRKKLSAQAIKLLTMNFFTSITSSMILPILLIFLQDKFSDNFNLIGIAYFPTLIISSLLGAKLGHFVDLHGKKKCLIMGSLILAGIYFIFPNVNSIVVFSILWCIETVCYLLTGPAEDSLYSMATDEDSHGELYGVYSSISSLGAIIGPLLGGIVYDKFSHGACFYMNGIVVLLATFFIAIFIKETSSSKSNNMNLNQ